MATMSINVDRFADGSAARTPVALNVSSTPGGAVSSPLENRKIPAVERALQHRPVSAARVS